MQILRHGDLPQQRERAIEQFHSHALGGLHALAHLDESQVHAALAKHLASGQTPQQGVANLPGSARDSHVDFCIVRLPVALGLACEVGGGGFLNSHRELLRW